MADKLLSLYDDLAQPQITYIKNRIYEGSTLLDILLKKKYMEEQRKDLTKETILKIPTYSGYSRRLFIDNGYALTTAEATDGIFKRVGDEVNTKHLESAGVIGEVIPAHINLAFTINRTRLMQIEELYKAQRDEELKMAVNDSMAKAKADLNFGLSWALMMGKGGNDNQFTNVTNVAPSYTYNYNYSTYASVNLGDGSGATTTGYGWHTAFSLPSTRQIEGIYTYALNPYGSTNAWTGTTNTYTGGPVSIYGISRSTNPAYNPVLYDFFTTVSGDYFSQAPFGYATQAWANAMTGASGAITPGTHFIRSSALMGKSASSSQTMTDGVPCIIDIISQAIADRKVNGEKPTIGLCRRNLFNLIQRAMISVQWGVGVGGQEKVQDLVKMGYTEQVVIDGVPIIPDDSKRDLLDASTVAYATPADAILLLNLDSMIFEAHKDYNFVEGEWKEVNGVIGQFVKEINATVRFSLGDLQKQALIQFGKISYSS